MSDNPPTPSGEGAIPRYNYQVIPEGAGGRAQRGQPPACRCPGNRLGQALLANGVGLQ